MKIARRCEGCPGVQGILSEPVRSFEERVTELTGKQVTQVSRGVGAQVTVFFEGDDVADNRDRDVSTAQGLVEGDVNERRERAAQFTSGCPGMLEATVEYRGTDVNVPVCGRVVVEAAAAQQVAG